LNILLVYPGYPETFWSFQHALRFISKKATFPPLGLLTVAAMFPDSWQRKLVNLNIDALSDEDIRWADYVFISAMVVQKESTKEIIARCNKLDTKVVAGGPLFTTGHDEFDGVDHFVLGEAEVTFPAFLEDIENGCAKPIYTPGKWPDINKTPVPQWSLIDRKHYTSMSIQYSRGCPYNCEFCDIIILNGHKPRTKDRQQIIDELDSLYHWGWRGSVFVVDDNFIGNKRKLKEEILPAIIEWRTTKKYPFGFFTEVSINLADDEELMRLLAEAGFEKVFIGIESPNEESLLECNKMPNKGRDLVASVKKIQNRGFEVQGGFILGFDSDPLSIFRSQINFIQTSGIVTAMVGLLNAPRGTQLYKRLMSENRLLKDTTGDNTDCSINFIPKMHYETLIDGYRQVVNTIYSPKNFYERIITFLREYRRPDIRWRAKFHLCYVTAFFKSMWILGVVEKGRKYYWKLFVSTLLKYPRLLPLSLSLAVYGFHFRKVAEKFAEVPVEDNLSPG
jgi:radical SAM superfamily enzyme YgiQ (UPF0313 family)